MSTRPVGASRSSALRRYPALAWLIGAGLLALLLPSGLTLPQSGPPTLAEYAPVPGDGSGQGDLAEVGLTSSDGTGAGSGRGSAAADRAADGEERAPAAAKVVRKAGTKRCVGNPARQTEDPLSPPCIAFFDGDNFGATAKGVTRDEVTVTVQMANTTTNNDRTDAVSCDTPYSASDAFVDAACKAFMRYFNDRYQTYGRTVRLISTGKQGREGLRERFNPFANIETGFSNDWARAGVLSAGYIGQRRSSYRDNAPLVIGFRPDIEDEVAMVGTFICDRLAGRPARYAGDPTLQTEVRKFGIVFYSGTADRRDRLKADLKERCGVSIEAEAGDNPNTTASLSALRTKGVTTVITIVPNTGHAVATNNATQLGWFPEWFVYPGPDLNGIDVNFHGRVANQAQWANAFGMSFDVRRSILQDQPWYRAYREGCAECPEPSIAAGAGTALFVASIYDAMSMLFYGVQAAGPRLTTENVDKGLHAIPARASTDPFRPAAYFAPGNYSFMKDAMTVWWDPSGRAPGAPNTGCYRLPLDGLRFRAGEWPAGDTDVKASGPCQGETVVG